MTLCCYCFRRLSVYTAKAWVTCDNLAGCLEMRIVDIVMLQLPVATWTRVLTPMSHDEQDTVVECRGPVAQRK